MIITLNKLLFSFSGNDDSVILCGHGPTGKEVKLLRDIFGLQRFNRSSADIVNTSKTFKTFSFSPVHVLFVHITTEKYIPWQIFVIIVTTGLCFTKRT